MLSMKRTARVGQAAEIDALSLEENVRSLWLHDNAARYLNQPE